MSCPGSSRHGPILWRADGVVDGERLHRLLRRVTDDLATLQRYAAAAEVVLNDPARLGHTKYLFVTAIEGCINAAQHICASEGYGPPASNADAVRLLARHGHLTVSLARDVAESVGFRNVLVHGYVEVDDEQVVANLERLDDLQDFVAELTRLIS